MEAVASRDRPKGGLGIWIAASLLPALPLVFIRLPEVACYAYQAPGGEVRRLTAILVVIAGLGSFLAFGFAFDLLRPHFFSRLRRSAVWALALAAAVLMIEIAFLGDPDLPLGIVAFFFFVLGIPLTALLFVAIVIAWVSCWRPAGVNWLLPSYLLSVGAFGYPGLLYTVFVARGGAFC